MIDPSRLAVARRELEALTRSNNPLERHLVLAAILKWAVQLMAAQWEHVDWAYVEDQANQQRIKRTVVEKAKELAREALQSADTSS